MADKKPFALPETLTGLSADELAQLRADARAEIDEINAVEGDLTIEQLDRIEALLSAVDAVDAQDAIVAEEAAALAARQEAARERVAALDKEPEPEPEAEPEPAEEPAPAEEPVEEPVEVVVEEPVLASAGRPSTIAAAKSRAPKSAPAPKKEEPPVSLVTITAAANIDGIDSGSKLDDMSQLTDAFLKRVQSFGGTNPKDMKPGVYKMSKHANKFGVANIRRADRENVVDREMSLEQQFAAIMNAGKLDQGLEGLVAAGGWCAPSETIYELFSYHTSEGLLDIPEVTARRGGIQFTKGPDFMTIFGDSDAGFIMTEAQAEAGTFTKPCYALECPPFQEIRLDAIGFCATSPILTEAAYPELVRQVLDMLGTGHARRKSQYTINKIVASISANTGAQAPVTFAPVGGAGNQSGLADSLAAAELRANQIRQSLAMSPNAVIEGMLPYWARGVFRTELSRRLGLSTPFEVTDADIDRFFAVRNVRFQYVYDLQMLGSGAAGTAGGTENWTAWPTTLDFYMWPAGAYTRLVNDVISLNAVYDHDLLTQNEYTAAFVEEGVAVANTRGFGLKTTVALNPEGTSGFPAIGAGAGVTFRASGD